ncbi:hypothetical protein [Mongoliibacter ruber]|nr:hypothetical protein [Mongoliibacter ruber]
MKNIFNSVSCVICIVLISFSCSQSDNSTEELRDEVIAIHDEVMPKMGELKSMRKDILKISENLQQEDSLGNTEKIQELESLAERMDQAFDGMFVWMRQYKPAAEEVSDEDYREYLIGQKEMVEKVNQDIRSTMAEARSVLESKN